jgi:ribosomal protein S18 acetylase RimI-like enzyme
VEKRDASVPSMIEDKVELDDVPPSARAGLDWILEESFEGWYLMHSRRTLKDVEIVRSANVSGKPIGLVMLKMLEGNAGYVYYIAVARAARKRGIGKLLLEDSLKRFKESGAKEVFASVEKDNAPSEALFASEGFTKTSFSEVSKKHGSLHTLNMYRVMTVVPGEILLHKIIN